MRVYRAPVGFGDRGTGEYLRDLRADAGYALDQLGAGSTFPGQEVGKAPLLVVERLRRAALVAAELVVDEFFEELPPELIRLPIQALS